MIISLQVILTIFTALFGFGTIAESDKDKQRTIGLVFVFIVTALLVTFVIG